MPATKTAMENADQLCIYPERLNLLDQRLQEWISKGYRQAISVKIMRKGQTIFDGSYGNSVSDSCTEPLTQDHIFPVASITKPIIATLLMQLQEDGVIDLCDGVIHYVPSFQGDDKTGVSIWHLLTHTSGMIEEDLDKNVKAYLQNELHYELPANEDDDDTWDTLLLDVRKKLSYPEMDDVKKAAHDTWIRIARKLPLSYPPRKVMSYCNDGYQMCREIITNVYGKSIDEIAQERLFKPLGMVDSHFVLPKEKFSRVVRRGENCEGYPWQNSERNFVSESGAGGLKTTANDIINFCEMIRCKGTWNENRILSPKSVECMCQDYNYDMNAFDSWAMGFNYKGKKFDDAGIIRPDTCLDHGGYGGTKIIIDAANELSMAFLGVYINGQRNLFSLFANLVYSSLTK